MAEFGILLLSVYKYTVNVTVKGSGNYRFPSWSKVRATVNGQEAIIVSGTGTSEIRVHYTFTPLPAAEPDSTYALTTRVNGGHGTLTESQTLKAGSEITVIFEPDPGYEIDTVTVNGVQTWVLANVLNITMDSDKTVAVTYKAVESGAPVITSQPKSTSVRAGENATFTVSATGDGLHYEWWGVDAGMPQTFGTDSPTLVVDSTPFGWSSFSFWCVVSNAKGEATSQKAIMTVLNHEFTDVADDAWYSSAVNWALKTNITNGTSVTSFSPGQNCTHAQILTFLYRAERGMGEAAASDMDEAVEWARGKGMIDGSFNGSRECTRSDAVYYIWQAFDKPSASPSSFSDVSANASYAKAVDWAVENGVTNGDGGNIFSPDKVCTRGHIVTFLHRAYFPWEAGLTG